MPFVHRDQGRLYWRADGTSTKPALLLGNSLGTDQSLWDYVIPELIRSYYVIRCDYRGHGASDLLAGPDIPNWSIGTLADDMLAIADAAGVDRFYFAGISIGGMIGIWLGAFAPGRLAGLVLSNTAAKLPGGAWSDRVALVRAKGMNALVDTTVGRWFMPATFAEGAMHVESIRRNFLAVNPEAYAAAGEALDRMDLRTLLPQVVAPTTVIVGTYDRSTPPSLGQEIVNGVANGRLLELPVAHIPHFDAPIEFVAQVVGLQAAAVAV
jgi:3-oxoadipate enol-lactonase